MDVEIEYGAEVIDKNGKVLGTIEYVMRNTWTGEISKFIVRNEKVGHLFFAPQDVLEVTTTRVKLNISLSEQSENA